MPFDKVVDGLLRVLFAGDMLRLAATGPRRRSRVASILRARFLLAMPRLLRGSVTCDNTVVACDRIFIKPVVQLQALCLFLLSVHRLLQSGNAVTG